MNMILVSDVIHKSVIEVNEEGSEAAAVTAVVIQSRSTSTHKVMIFDRPFYFILQDKKHCLNLFVGRIVDPSGKHELGNCNLAMGENVEHEPENVQFTDPNSREFIDPNIREFCGKYFTIPN